ARHLGPAEALAPSAPGPGACSPVLQIESRGESPHFPIPEALHAAGESRYRVARHTAATFDAIAPVISNFAAERAVCHPRKSSPLEARPKSRRLDSEKSRGSLPLQR